MASGGRPGIYIQMARGELHKNFVFRDCMISLGLDPGNRNT